MSGWRHHDGLPVSVTQGSGNSFKPGISPAGVCSLVPPHRREDQAGLSLPVFPRVAAWVGRATRAPGFVPTDRLPDAEQGKADRAGNLAA